MQLLKITSTPIEYRIEVSRPRLEVQQPAQVSMNSNTQPARIDIHTQDIKVRLDTTEMRSSIGLKSAPTLIKEASQRGFRAAQQATADYAQFGNQMAEIQNNVTISQIVSQQALEQPQTMTVFLPSVGPDISWTPPRIDLQYKEGNLSVDWKLQRNVMDYVPGKFKMSILQYPKVNIEYMGEPNYVPPSASPTYVEE